MACKLSPLQGKLMGLWGDKVSRSLYLWDFSQRWLDAVQVKAPKALVALQQCNLLSPLHL